MNELKKILYKKRPSYKSEYQHKDPIISFIKRYMETPMGKMGMSIFAKLFNLPEKDVIPEVIFTILRNDKNIILHDIDSSKVLNDREKFILYEIVNKFDVHNLKSLLKNAESERFDIVNYRKDSYGNINNIPPIDLLKRKKKSNKFKVKRSCGCK